MGFVSNYFCHAHNTLTSQMIISFVLGLIFSPFNSGLIYIILYIIFNEILVYIFSFGKYSVFWDPFDRCGVICSVILGFIIGRTLCQMDIESNDTLLTKFNI